jgi:hypothetical protein
MFKESRFALTRLTPILLLIIALSFGEELWKYNMSGKFLVSNYDHFKNAHNQFSGLLDKVEFFNFKLHALYQEPFMTENTSALVPLVFQNVGVNNFFKKLRFQKVPLSQIC